MEFEKTIQGALKTLNTALKEHESQRAGYERVIVRLEQLRRSVSEQSKVSSRHVPLPFFSYEVVLLSMVFCENALMVCLSFYVNDGLTFSFR
jgi:hypothetical protein